MAWLVGAFLFCPCHLPLALGLAATVLGGTVVGAMLRDHPVVAGTVIAVVWLAGTWRGVHLLRSARARAGCPSSSLFQISVRRCQAPPAR